MIEEKRADAATRLGFPQCPVCKKFCKLIGYAVAGFEELEIRACQICVERLESMNKLADEIAEITEICRSIPYDFTRKYCLTETNDLAHAVQI